MTNQARLEPLRKDEWPDELSEVRKQLGEPLNIHNMMAHHSELTLAWMNFRHHIVRHSTLTPRQRELLILRTALNCDADYEWKHHVVRGRKAGLSDEEIQRVKAGAQAAGWDELDALLLQAADEFHAESKMSDDTYARLSAHFDAKQLLDTCCTVGMYITLALILKTFEVPMENV